MTHGRQPRSCHRPSATPVVPTISILAARLGGGLFSTANSTSQQHQPAQRAAHAAFLRKRGLSRLRKNKILAALLSEERRLPESVSDLVQGEGSQGCGYGRADRNAQKGRDGAEGRVVAGRVVAGRVRLVAGAAARAGPGVHCCVHATHPVHRISDGCNSALPTLIQRGLNSARDGHTSDTCVPALLGYNGSAEDRLIFKGRERW